MDWGFRLEAQGDTLTIKRGLLEKKQAIITARRIRAVRVTENSLHRLFGMASVRIVVVGSSEKDKINLGKIYNLHIHALICLLSKERQGPSSE